MGIAEIAVTVGVYLACVITGGALVGFGWWLAVITIKTEYVPLPVFNKVKPDAVAQKRLIEDAKVAAEEDYTDVLDDRGEN
jgi:hypothetical protein